MPDNMEYMSRRWVFLNRKVNKGKSKTVSIAENGH